MNKIKSKQHMILPSTILFLLTAGGCRDSVGEDIELIIQTEYQLEFIHASICITETPLRSDSGEVLGLDRIYAVLLNEFIEDSFATAGLPTRKDFEENSVLMDKWNSPYKLHADSGKIFLTSYGPNRTFDNRLQDDISIELSNCELKNRQEKKL